MQSSVTPPGAAPTPVANAMNLYLTSNVISTWANGGIFRIANDAVEGLDPLSFFATLVLDSNTQGAGTVENGMLAIDKDAESAPSVLRPTGQPTTFYARSNTFITPLGGTLTNCSTVSGPEKPSTCCRIQDSSAPMSNFCRSETAVVPMFWSASSLLMLTPQDDACCVL